jgi:predicted ABC-type ATPase
MPQLWVVAGPNGAGKSTLVNKYLAGRVPLVNPDVSEDAALSQSLVCFCSACAAEAKGVT